MYDGEEETKLDKNKPTYLGFSGPEHPESVEIMTCLGSLRLVRNHRYPLI